MFRVRILFNASYAYRVNEPCFILDTIQFLTFFTASPIVYQTYQSSQIIFLQSILVIDRSIYLNFDRRKRSRNILENIVSLLISEG